MALHYTILNNIKANIQKLYNVFFITNKWRFLHRHMYDGLMEFIMDIGKVLYGNNKD